MTLTRSFTVSRRPPPPTDFPGPPGRRWCGHPAFTGLEVLFGCPIARRASLPTSLCAYRVGYPGATRKHDEPSWGHVQIFRTVPLANTLVRRVGKNAFAVIVPARPCPVFGRPIHHGLPLDYGPVLLLKPFRSHLAVDTLPSGCLSTVSRLSSSLGCLRRFRLRARLGIRLSAHPGQ